MLGPVPLLPWRGGAEISVIFEARPHPSGPLHEGMVRCGSGARACVRCAWHDSEFLLTTGEDVRGPPAPSWGKSAVTPRGYGRSRMSGHGLQHREPLA